MKPLNPCKLRLLSDEAREATAEFLGAIYKKHEQFLDEAEHDAETGAFVAVGLDTILEALGAEGHQAT